MQNMKAVAPHRKVQWEAVEKALADIKKQYTTQYPHIVQVDFLRAFIDYAYFSCFYAQCRCNDGASKRSWSLFRSRLAYSVAENLGLTECGN
ncbi:MAG: hypothetical protein E7418_05100 [Ruminococcaceae bacterium]|nr:hypothetical protein [Oscillospiraceae bacterium]